MSFNSLSDCSLTARQIWLTYYFDKQPRKNVLYKSIGTRNCRKDQHGYIFTYIFWKSVFDNKSHSIGLKLHETLGILFTFHIHKSKWLIVWI